MRYLYKYVILVSFIVAFFSACSDDTEPRYNPTITPQLTPLSQADLKLNQQAASFVAETFSWQQGNYGFSAAPLFILQMDTTNQFLTPKMLVESNKNFATVTVQRLNQITMELGGEPDEACELYIRLVTKISSQFLLYSDPLDILVTPYAIETAE